MKIYKYKEKYYAYVDEILPDIDIDYEHYVKCEQEVISPALIGLGFALAEYQDFHLKYRWYTADGDSFGPLSRAINSTVDGKPVIVCYG